MYTELVNIFVYNILNYNYGLILLFSEHKLKLAVGQSEINKIINEVQKLLYDNIKILSHLEPTFIFELFRHSLFNTIKCSQLGGGGFWDFRGEMKSKCQKN